MTATADEPSKSLEHRAVGGSAWIVIGYGANQLIRLFSNALLTRLLPPSVFGINAIVLMFLQAIHMFSDLGIHASLVQNSRGDDESFVNTAWTLQVLRGFFLWGIALVCAYPLAYFYGESSLRILLPVAGLAAIAAGFNSTALATLTRHLKLGPVTKVELAAQFIGVAVMIVWAMISPSVWALIAGALVTAVANLIFSHRLDGVAPRFTMERQARGELIKFGWPLFVSTAFTFLASQGDRFVLSAYVPVALLGVYWMAAQLSQVGIAVLGSLSNSVIFPLYARIATEAPESLRPRILKIRTVLLVLAMPLPAILVVFGDLVVQILFGEEFHDAGWMLQLLSVGMIFEALTSTIAPAILATGRTFRFMCLLIARGGLVLAAAWIGVNYSGIEGLILGVVVAQAASYPVLVWAVWPTRTWMPFLDLAALVYAAGIIFLGQLIHGVIQSWVFLLVG